jgi:hypothetical protein
VADPTTLRRWLHRRLESWWSWMARTLSPPPTILAWDWLAAGRILKPECKPA